MNVKDKLRIAGLRSAYSFLEKDPKRNIFKLLDTARDFIGKDKPQQRQWLEALREKLSDRQGVWYRHYCQLWDQTDAEVMRSLFENMVLNAGITGRQQRQERGAALGCAVPPVLWLDAGAGMSPQMLDGLIRQGRSLGIYLYILGNTWPGHFPDMSALCLAHKDCQFLGLMDGAYIDDAVADSLRRAKNLIVAVGVTADGPVAAEQQAMRLLRQRREGLGAYCCCTAKNAAYAAGGACLDTLIGAGAAFLLLTDADGSDAMTQPQRAALHGRLHALGVSRGMPVVRLWYGEPAPDAALNGRCVRVRPGKSVLDALRATGLPWGAPV